MKKKIFLGCNLLVLTGLAACTWIYTNITGSLRIKGITASCFVMLGLVNLVYALFCRPRRIAFPLTLCAGLTLAMLGDILLGKSFLLGAGLFAAGHILYAAAMYIRQKCAPLDIGMTGVMLLLAWFAGAGSWADTACLWTYFPGQGLLAHAGYWYVRSTSRSG